MEGEGEKRDAFLEREESIRSPGLLLQDIGFASVFVAAPRAFEDTPDADNALSQGIAHAPSKMLKLFADKNGRTVYAGNEEEMRDYYETLGLEPVEVYVDDYLCTLLSIGERGGRFVFSLCPSGALEQAHFVTVEALRKGNPRATF